MRTAAFPRGFAYCAALSLAILLAGCATPPSDPAKRAAFAQNNDPLEPMNREILDLNLLLDRILLKPVTKIYIAVVPEEARDAVRRALANMKEPVVVINNVMQGELKRATVAATRFTVNSTIGIGGLLDIANNAGLKPENGDFGQTLFVWGMPEGPYLVLPIFGPSNPRDAVGMIADSYMDPFSYLASVAGMDQMQVARYVIDGIDQRAQVMDILDELQKNSLDFYAQLRSLAQQRRAAELRHGTATQPGANLYEDPNKAPSGAAPKPASAAPPSARP